MKIPTEQAMERYPFLRDIQLDMAHIPLEINSSEYDYFFMNESLLEDESEAAGHFNVKKTLYVVRDDRLNPVDVNRWSTKIYPPEYLHPGMEFPPDEPGWSETVFMALSRQDMAGAHYVVLYKRGSDGYTRQTNNILIAPFNKANRGKAALP